MDDQQLVLRSTARLLVDFETVVKVQSARKALVMLEHELEFDVVVSDVMMPEMSGPELYRRCYAHSPSLADRFVFASGDPESARRLVAAAARQVGADRIPPLLAKPTPKDLLVGAVRFAAINRALESGTFASQPESAEPIRVANYRG